MTGCEADSGRGGRLAVVGLDGSCGNGIDGDAMFKPLVSIWVGSSSVLDSDWSMRFAWPCLSPNGATKAAEIGVVVALADRVGELGWLKLR